MSTVIDEDCTYYSKTVIDGNEDDVFVQEVLRPI
jgi:hypothetical protein